MDYLDNDIKFVGGVGEARARLLDKELGIRTLGDMLRHYPFRYIDRTKVYRIAEITDDAPTLLQFRARVTGVAYAGTGRKRRFTAYVSDPTGSAELVWFQGIKWIEKRVEVGREYLIFGRPSFYRGELSMAHPELETMEQALSRKAESGMQGIYPSTEKLSNVLGAKGMYQIICNAWALAKDHIPDYMPDEVRTRYGLIPLRDAYYNIHFPQSPELLRQAQYRLKFDELLGIQLNVQSRRTERLAKNNGFLFMKVGDVFNTFYNEKLPFPLTGAQKRVIREIRQDTVTGYQMNRLLQGDVGSGKTLVAAAAIWACIRAGYQAALLAPTEILAAQHAEGLNRLLAPFGMRVALLTGGMKAAARRTTLAAIRKDEADLVVGTHALMSEGVEFARLGLAVIDEQHRFGVRQRGALAEKAANPHLLVMSATPIPRTLGLLIYGDLDISILDELPPGRTPVKTRCITGKRRRDLYRFLDSEIDKGRQVYLVCPAIEDVPDGGLNAVKTYYEDIAKTLLPDRRVGLMHGKLKPKEKAAVMEDFKAGQLDALVSTTVIEVGVDVPNASVMVIENAERYGLSALHQLRGRVGRGAAESWCFLVSDNTSEAVQKRLKFLCSTTDGFAVAQYDLETRGPGDFFGSRQHGLPTLQIADLMNDTRTLHAAQSEAAALLAADPLLESPAHALLAAQVQQMFDKAGPMN